MLVLERTVESDRLSDAAKAELKALLDPETMAITVAVLALWAASHLTPFGYIADALNGLAEALDAQGDAKRAKAIRAISSH